MIEFDMCPSKGVFDPPALRDLAGAFEKAERHIDRLRSSAFAEIDRDRVARRIIAEARCGETQPDLVWRAAVAKVLLETRTASQKAGGEPLTRAAGRLTRGRCEEPAGWADMPPAGSHATPQNTNADATPGSGALPGEPPGDEVDPATG